MNLFHTTKPKKKTSIEKYSWHPIGSKEVIEVILRRSAQSRAIRILVNQEGRVTVTGPLRASKVLLVRVLDAQTNWVLRKREELSLSGVSLIKLAGSAKEFQEHKEEALSLVKAKLEYWNRYYGHVYNQVTVRNQSTRWGSCSAKGNLNFHYRILFLPEPLVDYLIVHELCHLKAFDHSPRFWALVAETIPDYQERRKALRHNIR
jgi:predicted metal-dependent hydrolase